MASYLAISLYQDFLNVPGLDYLHVREILLLLLVPRDLLQEFREDCLGEGAPRRSHRFYMDLRQAGDKPENLLKT